MSEFSIAIPAHDRGENGPKWMRELLDTLKQLYNLLWFCKKVNIPFEVYAFTNDCPNPDTGDLYEKKPGQICIESTFSLMNLFTSKV